MKRKWLAAGISIIAVILLTLTSLSNVVGYQTVRTSQQNLIEEKTDQRGVLFQTIVDIANNKEIQQIILRTQMTSGIIRVTNTLVVTKNQLIQMYILGLFLSKIIRPSRIQSMIHHFQLIHPEVQEELRTVIEKDAILHRETTQLQNIGCDCKKDTSATRELPIICTILGFIALCGSLYFMFLGKYVYGWAVDHNRTAISTIVYFLIWSYYFSIIPIIYLMIFLGCIEIPFS